MARSFFANLIDSNKVILANAGSLVGTQAVTSALGFLYWWLAAHLFVTEAVGVGSASISAMMLLGNLAVFGFGTLLIGELPRHKGREPSIISAALILVAVAGLIFGILFTRLAPIISPDLASLGQNLQSVALFSAGVSLTAVVLVVDQALIGMLRGELQFVRNIIFATAKLLAILAVGIWLANQQGMSIYATWLFGNLFSLLILLGYGYISGTFTSRTRPLWGWLRNYGKPALEHHGLNLTLQAPALIMPLIVTAVLSADANAYFYTAWMIAGFVFVVPIALTTVLYALGSADPGALGQKVRMTLRLSFAFGLLANLFLLVGANLILSLFGENYAAEASLSLRILALAVFPITIRIHYVAICRIFRRITRAALWMGAGGLLEIAFAWIGAGLAGLPGLCTGWLLAVSIEAALMLPTVVRVARGQSSEIERTISESNAPLPN